MHFEVFGICVILSKLQFTDITRLKCYGNISVNHSKLEDCIRARYFTSDSKSTNTVKRETIELMFEKLHAGYDEDAMKVALIYLILHACYPTAKNVGVSDVVFHLANDLNAFNDYL